MPTKKKSPPWKRLAPKDLPHHKLSASQKVAARARAKQAGRNYPNLIDNMGAARKKPVATPK